MWWDTLFPKSISDLAFAMNRLVSTFGLFAIALGASCAPTLKEHPFTFQKSNKLEKADPVSYWGRIAFPWRVIELYRHTDDHQAIIMIGGKAVKSEFNTLLAGKTLVAESIREIIPDAHDISTKVVEHRNRRFLIVKFKLNHGRVEYEYWDSITQENKDQYHFMASFPVGTPESKVRDLLSILETLAMKP